MVASRQHCKRTVEYRASGPHEILQWIIFISGFGSEEDESEREKVSADHYPPSLAYELTLLCILELDMQAPRLAKDRQVKSLPA